MIVSLPEPAVTMSVPAPTLIVLFPVPETTTVSLPPPVVIHLGPKKISY